MFDLKKYASGDEYIYDHLFESGPFEGFSLKYRQSPADLKDKLIEEFDDELTALACPDNGEAYLFLVSGGTMSPSDKLGKWLKIRTDEAGVVFDRMAAAFAKHHIGDWNQEVPITTEVILSMPKLLRIEIARLIAKANGVGLTGAQKDFLPK